MRSPWLSFLLQSQKPSRETNHNLLPSNTALSITYLSSMQKRTGDRVAFIGDKAYPLGPLRDKAQGGEKTAHQGHSLGSSHAAGFMP